MAEAIAPSGGFSGVSPLSLLVHKYLAEAETRYGPRFPNVTFNVEEGPNGPDATFDAAKNFVAIRLVTGLNEYDRQAQLAHEAIHVFSPANANDATFLDEGLATLFAKQLFNYFPPRSFLKYQAALAAMESLIAECPGIIQALMTKCGRLALVTPADINGVCGKISIDHAAFLTRKFW